MIGIDNYAAWPRLDNAVSDAAAASRLFRRLGFDEVTAPLLDGAATGDAMRRLVTEDLALLSSDDSLVLFFAGHGHTHTTQLGDTSVKTGCVIPVDAMSPPGHVSASWLRLDTWLSDIARLPPRHILVIVDACHSGISLGALHKWRADGPGPARQLAALQARRSRRIITSALDDQLAMDGGPYPGHSLFTGCLLEALSGGLAWSGQRVATGRDLGNYLQKRVSSYPPSLQTPDFGTFELDDRGDIVVPLLCDAEPVGSGAIVTGPTRLPDVLRRVVLNSWRPRLGLWITLGLVTSALVVWTARGVGDDSRPPGATPSAPVDTGSSSPTLGAIGERTAAPRVQDPSDPDVLRSMITRDTPPITYRPASATPAASLDPAKPAPSASPHGQPLAPRARPTTPAAPKASSPPAAERLLAEIPDPTPPALERCSKADFAVVYEATSPTRDEVHAALRDLNVCHEARAINDADFERYQTALVTKL